MQRSTNMEPTHVFFFALGGLFLATVLISRGVHHFRQKERELRRGFTPECGGRDTYES